MDVKKVREFLETEVVNAYRKFLETKDTADLDTVRKNAVKSTTLGDLFSKMFGSEAYDDLMDKYFS